MPLSRNNQTAACAEITASEPIARAESGAAPGYPAVLLQVFAVSGYGIWILLGMALALGIYRDGRSESLVPLAVGAIFVSIGLVSACLRLPWMREWHGWQPAQSSWPTREALLALTTYLPMLAVAGLVRGENGFWATRLAGAALMLCSMGSLTYTVRGYRRRLTQGLRRQSDTQLPAGRVVLAWYGGGLWLWLCLVAQDGAVHPVGTRPWIMALLILQLLLGLIEGMRWQALHAADIETRIRHARSARFIAAAFTYAIPSVALLLIDLFDASMLLVAVAALSSVLGKSIEQHAYVSTLVGRDSIL